MIKAVFAGNKKVTVNVDGYIVNADLPKEAHGDDSAANPFQLMMAALMSCSAVHAMFFLDKIGFDKKDIHLEMKPVFDERGNIETASIVIFVPKNFPADKEASLLKSVENCKVGMHMKFPRTVLIARN